MIQLNLLPDVKLEYIKAQRSRRLVTGVSLLSSVVAVALLLLMLSVNVLQKRHLDDLSRDITKDTATLQAKPDINKILTVQNQLQSLTSLHSAKPAVSRLFEYLNTLTPTQVSMSSFNLDYTDKTIQIIGGADSLSNVNKYIDTLKFTTYTDGEANEPAKAFSDVVLGSFNLSNGAQNAASAANYTLSLSYDPIIFDITKTVKLAIPNQVTTRSELNQGSTLFQAGPTNTGTTGTEGR